MDVSVIVPTFNEAPNVPELVRRIETALEGRTAEIVFVDDSTDDTPAAILRAAARAQIPVRLIHRDHPAGGLSGAVLGGLAATVGEWCVVMDGDLQHPPELIPVLLASGVDQVADVVVASRHISGGSSAGLSGFVRRLVSSAATVLTRAMFPTRLRNCTDPMTGFFAVRRSSVDLGSLRPRGFKILLEILARNAVTVVEVPFVFGERHAGESKADFRQGLRFVTQLATLRFGRLSGFALIGALGAVGNLAIMALLQAFGVWYLLAAIIAAVVTMVTNFLLQERFVFHDLREEGRHVWTRLAQSFGFNGAETTLRTYLLWVVVSVTSIPSVAAQAALLTAGFVLRFVYHSRVVYRPKRTSSAGYGVEAAPGFLADRSAGNDARAR
ncbi:glycosyltransferase [Cryobacterium sp. TMT1-21]|uniref:Glycosyltransferase n=1 Tax=Cryobacterium shii TaxID=1259235 RepID=A0AAQ2HEU1_9MICO|nr:MULTISPECIES: glycosyltransferase [Cryobacterium]TFC42553.1 glycosyltransferase [Cryobacterium shii]TFC80885.1 glycosyltransferase [Cryobacterium sp. TmT2-59]TFD13188.1 glycosyltransferase [Cryobacterium sp. TMT1-21]TFD18609.1 glycosyltransferase [Cryobacterium sp. TMT4-10]TFD28410.1 glycosyltransferase [Cryobacterium sp. TMT2-23]